MVLAFVIPEYSTLARFVRRFAVRLIRDHARLDDLTVRSLNERSINLDEALHAAVKIGGTA
jgi:hypothetical protein